MSAAERNMSGARDYSIPPSMMPARYLEACAATASRFLYAQGTSVVCCHQDTLTIERRFSGHGDEVQLLAVDNTSDIGAGRLAVSCDASQTAIVWNLMTGDEVARFSAFETLTSVAFERSGNVVFGTAQGQVMRFETTTSEHLSRRTLDQIAVTAIAPAADLRTLAIGYQNGSLLIATIEPRFTILHNLCTSRAPSPVVTLSWHGSSSRQKSDMLAVQTNDGDLRVWSVAKEAASSDRERANGQDEPVKVVRVLERSENYADGPNWMAWSKNGRVVQFSQGETISWDVRTKHITFDRMPTLDVVRGLAVYGPGASLFTLGANNTVQQFDLNAPARMVANVQHPASLLPPSPPLSLEEQGCASLGSTSERESMGQAPISESEEEQHMSPLARLVRSGHDPGKASAASGCSQSMWSRSSHTPGGHGGSTVSRGLTERTHISAGSSVPSRPSRLRHELARGADDARVHDLFKFTRTRLADAPYHQPSVDSRRMTNDERRRQMLRTLFGWSGEVHELVRDEMARHAPGSGSRILLAKWLGDMDAGMDAGMVAASSQNMTSSDWMLLALSGIGGGAASQQHKLGRAYVQRLLEGNQVHAAAAILLGMGDADHAIETYVSSQKYMEALLLTCLCFPAAWDRQEGLVKRWGEWAQRHRHQQLALACVACTFSATLSPPLSPPSLNHGPQRSLAKASSLKLITSFGPDAQSKFFGGQDGAKTPLAGGVTPIAESALSPNFDPATAVLGSCRSAFQTPTSARPAYDRPRLPSIGEAATGACHVALEEDMVVPTTPSPAQRRRVKIEEPPSPSPRSLAALMEGPGRRNGSRCRMPDGLDLHLAGNHYEPTSPDASSSARYHWPSRRRGPAAASVASSATSTSAASSRSRGRRRDLSRGRGHTPQAKPSPTSPVPMSPEDLNTLRDANEYDSWSDDEHDYRLEPSFGRKKDGSTSRTPKNKDKKNKNMALPPEPRPTPAPMQLETDGAGHMRVVKDERQRKKEAAARELEERRRSLARRPLVPAIPHPDDLSPAPLVMTTMGTISPPPRSGSAIPGTNVASAQHLPVRSQSTDPIAQTRPMMGLPATPKAMRLVREAQKSSQQPPPPIGFAPSSSSSSSSSSPFGGPWPPKTNLKDPMPSPQIILPSTVYSPPTPARTPLARSASAPPEDLAPPASRSHASNVDSTQRRPSHQGTAAHHMAQTTRRPSRDKPDMPPPLLKELQHLATPPPPPPPPGFAGYSASQPPLGVIEIVMDDGTVAPVPPPAPPASAPPLSHHKHKITGMNETTVPILAPPAPPSSATGARRGHQRGRSSVDNSIGARISRATERMRSGSRTSANRDKHGSPDAAFRAVASPVKQGPPVSLLIRSPVQMQTPQAGWKTGLHRSEMI